MTLRLRVFAVFYILLRYFDGDSRYFFLNAVEKYSRLSKPDEKQISVMGRFEFFIRFSAFFRRVLRRYWWGEYEVKVLKILLKWNGLTYALPAISFRVRSRV